MRVLIEIGIIKATLCALSASMLLTLSACQSTRPSLFDELGGHSKISEITDNFINEISFNPHIAAYFANSNIERFRSKLNEHLCVIANGPCEYTGDDMLRVHQGMDISEHHFNLTVDLLIEAMNKADVAHPTQNKVLAKLVPLRKDIIYQ